MRQFVRFWDIIMIAFMLGGAALSVTWVILAWGVMERKGSPLNLFQLAPEPLSPPLCVWLSSV